MMPFSKIWYCVVIVLAAILVTDITNLYAETNGNPVSKQTKLSNNASKVDPTTQVVPQQGKPVLPSTSGNVDSATQIELQRLFNELREKYLDTRDASLDRWMWLITALLALFGLILPITLAVISNIMNSKRVQEFEAEARQLVDEIKEHREQSEAHLRKITSIDIDDPDKVTEVEKVIRNVQSDPEPSFIDKVIAEIYTLQRSGRVGEAIKKWRFVANIAEGIDNDRAFQAWLSIAYLMPEGNDRLAAYDKAMVLDPNYTRSPRNQPISRHSMQFHDTIVVGAVLRYFNEPKFEKFSIAQEGITGPDRYRADVLLHDEEGQLVVIVECKVNEDIARGVINHFKEIFRHSDARFGLLTAGTDISKWTFFAYLEMELPK